MSIAMDNLLGQLLLARTVAHVLHWKVKSLSLHLALGELYEQLTELTDELAEIYMGTYGTEGGVPVNDPAANILSQDDPLVFIKELHDGLAQVKDSLPQDGFIINKYEEIQALVSRAKFKMENLK